MENAKKDLISLCGLWKQTSKTGVSYLSGSLGGCRVMVFRNENKKDEKSPDYSVCLAPRERQEHGSGDGL